MGGWQSTPAPESSPTKDCDCWREISWNSREQLLKGTREYTTDMDTIPQVNILLVGNVGSGKSSFFNTVDSAFKGRIAAQAESKTTGSSTSVTKQFSVYKPGGRRGQPVAFNFCDTMGMELEDGLAVEDMVYVFDGHIPDGFKFDPRSRITPADQGFVPGSNLAVRMHCIGLIINGATLEYVTQEEKQKFRQISMMASARGLAMVVVVTHIDEVCDLVQKDTKMAHKSVAVKDVVEQVSHVTGFNLSQIFPVRNYCVEVEIDSDIDVLALKALKKMLDYADDYMDKNPK